MATDFSLANGTLTLNSTVISGWSDDEDAFTIEPQEVGTVTYGADGKMTSTKTGTKGATITLKLKPNAASTIFLSTLFEQYKKNVSVIFSGTYVQHVNNTSLTLDNGVFISGPAYPTMGKGAIANMEYQIAFETVAGNFVNANFI